MLAPHVFLNVLAPLGKKKKGVVVVAPPPPLPLAHRHVRFPVHSMFFFFAIVYVQEREGTHVMYAAYLGSFFLSFFLAGVKLCLMTGLAAPWCASFPFPCLPLSNSPF